MHGLYSITAIKQFERVEVHVSKIIVINMREIKNICIE